MKYGLPIVRLLRAGRLSYNDAVALQHTIRDNVMAGKMEDTLILVEHPPVYTVGIRDQSYNAEEEARLRALGAEFCRTNRGGLITFHGPGQLVVYPILDLKRYQPSVRWYVCHLEKTIIQLCAHYGLEGSTSIHTGVWVNDAKICAMGVHVSRYITTHGLALNCDTDLTWFSHIVPCGIKDKSVTSLSQQLNRTISIQDAIPHFIKAFQDIFQVDCRNLEDKSRELLVK